MVEDDSWKSHRPIGTGLATGDFAFDKFKIMKSLGSGGMGTVYKAKDTVLNRIVALKVMKAQSLNDRELLRFQNESRLACRLHHPNIAAIYDLGLSKNGQLFMSMEFVHGTTLQRLLADLHKLPVKESLEIVLQVCQALRAAHNDGIIHRDVKPANIMIIDGERDAIGTVKLLDFGIATKVDVTDSERLVLTAPGRLIGSPSYMSPEQCSASPVVPESDIYSLGCVLFECLVGRPPFVSESLLEIVVQHTSAPPPELSQLMEPGQAEELTALVKRMLDKVPANRCTAREACELLEALIAECQGVQSEGSVEGSKKSDVKSKGFSISELWIPLTAIALLSLTLLFFVSYEQNSKPKTMPHQEFNTEFIVNREEGETETVENMMKEDSSELRVSSHGVTDSELSKLQGRKNLKKLYASDSQITSAGLKYLSQLQLTELDLNYGHIASVDDLGSITTLEALGLASNNVTSIAGLRPLKNLKKLDLSDTKISDQSLGDLAPLVNLTSLNLARTKITDAAINHVLPLKKLTSLDLSDTEITAAATRKLAAFRSLKALMLTGCKKISPGDILVLKSLPSLSLLGLGSSKFKFSDLARLSNFPSLRAFDLSGCHFSDDEIRRLRRLMPLVGFDSKGDFRSSSMAMAMKEGLAGKPAQALAHLLDAVDCIEKTYGKNCKELAAVLAQASYYEYLLDHYDQGLKHLTRATALLDERDPRFEQIMQAPREAFELCQKKGRLADAEKLYQLMIRSSWRLGDERLRNLNLARAYLFAGALQWSQGHHAKSERTYYSAIQCFGKSSEEAAAIHHTLAECNWTAHKLERALKESDQCIHLRDKLNSPESFLSVQAKVCRATYLLCLNRDEECNHLLESCFSRMAKWKHLDRDHSLVICRAFNTKAMWAVDQKNFPLALEMIDKALAEAAKYKELIGYCRTLASQRNDVVMSMRSGANKR